ncbi:hypothetical protein EYZ11_012287 [Aspergillus tanneri]|uniref:Uncharacterized protein n=1 Tax=Aspergillus tanneri TaxID=1220188 RepID=A0A4S3J0W4_9EURO|nr:hypothetical protein EYZ11_012287 [Aspergillus tanneri]
MDLNNLEEKAADATWETSISDWAGHKLNMLSNSCDKALYSCCNDIDDSEKFLEHVTGQSHDIDSFDKWVWHGGYADKPWIEHTAECWHLTDKSMRKLETLSQHTGLPNGWWSILQKRNNDASVKYANDKSRFKNHSRSRYPQTMYQGSNAILDSIFVTDVGDATLNYAALGFISMPKTLIYSYACTWTNYALCEIGADYANIPIHDIQYAWAYALKELSVEACNPQWIRESGMEYLWTVGRGYFRR